VLVKWTKDLELGVAFVDADHKVLIKLLNQINDCIDQHEESTIVGSVLEALVEYTDYHFRREEKMLEACGYLALEAHMATHRHLSGQVRKIYTDYQTEPWEISPADILAFLKSWLVEHIMGHDFEYRDACVGNPAAEKLANELSFFEQTEQAPFSDWANLRIMLVDDNPNFRRLINTLLKAVGVRHLQLVSSAREGVAKLSQNPADVVLCDMVMDGMNGIDFARELQTMNLSTRVIMMTGYSTDEMKDRGAGLSIQGYLEKPIKARSLLESIAKAAV